MRLPIVTAFMRIHPQKSMGSAVPRPFTRGLVLAEKLAAPPAETAGGFKEHRECGAVELCRGTASGPPTTDGVPMAEPITTRPTMVSNGVGIHKSISCIPL